MTRRQRIRDRYRALVIAGWVRNAGYEEALRRGRKRGWITHVDKDWNIHLAE